MRQINWGIIGLGNIALKFAEGFHNIENSKLLAISSKNKNKLLKFKETFHINKNYCFNSYEELLKCNEIDIIYIALPNSLHYEWVLECIKNKKRVLVEKPATINLFQIKDIQKRLKENGIMFTEGFMYRYLPQINKSIELIKENAIGKLTSMESYFGKDILSKKNIFGFNKRKKINKNSRLYSKELGGGAILDLGCYPVSFSILIASLISNIDLSKIYLFNNKKEISDTNVDLDSYLDLSFDNKFTSKIGASFSKNLGKKTVINGENGKLIIEDTWHGNPSLIKIEGKNNNTFEIDTKKNIFSYQIENLSECILKNNEVLFYPGMKLKETIMNMEILEKWLKDEK